MVYKGKPLLMADLITRPEHSIIRQSYDSRERKESTGLPARLNADGFGVGWYAPEVSPNDSTPCVFVSTLPAWNNRNLSRLCDKITSPLIFAHIRAASPKSIISESNCHPFASGQFLFMHNGHVAGFSKIRRKLIMELSDESFNAIQGSTDSEHVFALFLNQLRKIEGELTPRDLLQALIGTIHSIMRLVRDNGVTEHSYLNFAVSDGSTVVASRVLDDPKMDRVETEASRQTDKRAASLYFSSGTAFKRYGPGEYKMAQRDRCEEVVIVASERLTHVIEDWVEVPDNSLLLITPTNNVQIKPLVKDFCTA